MGFVELIFVQRDAVHQFSLAFWGGGIVYWSYIPKDKEIFLKEVGAKGNQAFCKIASGPERTAALRAAIFGFNR